MNGSWLQCLSGICFSCLILIGCSKNPSYEDQISNILVYEEGVGEFTNEQFEKVLKLIQENPETFNVELEGIDRFNSVLSDDKKVKVYCFDINDSHYGYGAECRVILQDNVDGKIRTILLPDTITAIESIYHLTDNHYLFIAASGSIHQGVYMYKQANVYDFDKHAVRKLTNAFCAGDKKIDEIEVQYEQELSTRDDEIYVLLAYRNDGIIDSVDEIDKLAILYNQLKKELYVADTGEASEGSHVMTGTFKHFRWDGKTFKDITLIEPLEAFNKDYYICIQQNNDGSCTYMSWNGGKKIGKPDLVIRDGIRQLVSWHYRCPYNEWITNDESVPDSEEYIFQNNGYTYRYTTGWSQGTLLDELEVYDPDEDLIYSGNFKLIE